MKYCVRKKISLIVTGSAFLCLMNSCISYKNIPYIQDVTDTSKPVLSQTIPFKNPLIQPDDILSINIQTLDAGVSTVLNSTTNAPAPQVSTSQQQIPSGYLVDKNGEVELPFTGKIKLEGLTTQEARDKITTEVAKQFNSPVVSVRFANFKITVLGEVVKPSTYVVPNEKVNIFDALGLAGDMTIFGKRENVLLMRDTLTDQKEMIRLDLNSKAIVSSPYFYLRPNDIIYVEPRPEKIASLDAARTRTISLVAAGISLLVVIFAKVVK